MAVVLAHGDERSTAFVPVACRTLMLLGVLVGLGAVSFWNDNPSLMCLGRDIISRDKTTVGFAGGGTTAVATTASYAEKRLPYEPSEVESYIIANSNGTLNYAGADREHMAQGCQIWTDPNLTPYYQNLQDYRIELNEYSTLLKNFNGTVKDLREHMTEHDKSICNSLELNPNGLSAIFSKSKALSRLPGGGGYIEPLAPPLRHPELCFDRRGRLMDMGYLVHDFASLCRNRLHPTSRTVFIDMGAALDFHGDAMSPAVYVTHMYQKFGFHFDHIYAYEIVEKKPEDVYNRIPNDIKAAYHWYNVGVASDPESPNNPLTMLINNFKETDFVVVKLDIDTGFIENPLAREVLDDPRFHNLIDAFYFEHHVFLAELPEWGNTMVGSVDESLKLFYGMREKGISSHYWP